jgi:anti-sigma B factor antagonist
MPNRPGVQIDVGADQTGVTVTIAGEIDIAAIGRLEHARATALAEQPDRVLIDLRRVDFIDSSGLKFLLETDRLSKSAGWKLQLLRPAESARKALVLTGADKHLPFVDG